MHTKVIEEFTDKLKHEVNRLSVGDGLTDGVEIGPMINRQACDDVLGLIRESEKQGAKTIVGGEIHAAGKNYMQPTIMTDVRNDMPVATNEIFGPVSVIIPFSDEAEVIAMANDTEFGLAAYFYARDIGRIWRVAEGLAFGMVGINEGIISNAAAPFGGVKQSGNGREGSKYGLDDYLEIKYLCMGGLDK